jgi:endoglucanase
MRASPRATAVRILIALALLSGVMASLGAGSASAWDSTMPTSGLDNPLANKPWFVNWDDKFARAQEQFLSYLTNGHPERTANVVYGGNPYPRGWQSNRDFNTKARREVGKNPYYWLQRVPEPDRWKASLMLKIARNPQTLRFGKWTDNVRLRVRQAMRRVEAVTPGGVSFVYIYRQQASTSDGKCGNHMAGGARDLRSYKRWIRIAAHELYGHEAIVFLEPDGLGMLNCLSGRKRKLRYAMFRYAIKVLTKNPKGAVYLDAARSNWIRSVRAKARILRKMGVMHPRVRGFFTNSTGYQSTANELRYGNKLSRMLGGKHFIVSTHMNGRGTYRIRIRGKLKEVRCNPPKRALGPEPTVRTASSRADAYVWLGNPGMSAGCTHRGQPKAPKAQKWWEWYALDLARRASWQ